ncbi:Hca operon transcriptional activator [Cronobacter sakazakii]|nr:Hca operon transcriptional activator [Cronobacter sakazakii]
MNIELRHLRYFVAVAEELHFGRAAARLNISQPPLSQQIQALEAQTGARLLARTNRSVTLTAAGRQFLADSRQILSEVEAAAVRAARLHNGETGELRIGFTSSAPFIRAISDTLSVFRRRYPDVHLQTLEINTRSQIAPLTEGRLDVGLMRNTPLPETLAWQLVLREPLLALIPCDHPLAAREEVSISELAGEPFVFFDPHVGTGLYDDILGLLHRYGVQPRITQGGGRGNDNHRPGGGGAWRVDSSGVVSARAVRGDALGKTARAGRNFRNVAGLGAASGAKRRGTTFYFSA